MLELNVEIGDVLNKYDLSFRMTMVHTIFRNKVEQIKPKSLVNRCVLTKLKIFTFDFLIQPFENSVNL